MASQKFAENIIAVCEILQQRGLQYLIVGGTAVAFHGYVRPTANRDGSVTENDDFDFWYNPRYLNYLRLLDCLEDMGLNIADVREEEFVNLKRSFFRFRLSDFMLDFIREVAGNLTFQECHSRRFTVTFSKIEVEVLPLPDLIAIKKATGRKKDIEDVIQLEKLQENGDIQER